MRPKIGFVTLAIVALFVNFCKANEKVYMTVYNHEGNQIEGPGDDGSVELFEFSHKLLLPLDLEEWTIVGPRETRFFNVIKEIDQTSPQLQDIINNGRTLQRVVFTFVKNNELEQEEEYFHITIEDVNVLALSSDWDLLPDSTDSKYLEALSFLPKKITWTDVSGITYSESFFKMSSLGFSGTSRGTITLWDEGVQLEGPLNDGSSSIHSFQHNIVLPYTDGNFITGARQHRPIFVDKGVDLLTPQLMSFTANGKNLTEVKFSFYRKNPDTSGEEEYYHIIIEDVRIVCDSTHWSALTGPVNFSERLGFIYKRITWKYLDGGIEYTEELFGSSTLVSSDNRKTPADFQLQNYPNPFNGSTNITFTLPEILQDQLTTVTIYNTRGQLVRELFNGILRYSSNTVHWDGTNASGLGMPTGLYFYRVRIGSESFSKRLALIR